jgi:Protein of unknown function (DUF3094)
MNEKRQLNSEDQARVDEYLRSGYNDVERKPFRPWRLLLAWWIVVVLLGFFALGYTRYYGII